MDFLFMALALALRPLELRMLTRPPEEDVESLYPGMAELRRTAVRLHPRRGNPGLFSSHVGFPFPWPQGSDWPYCQHHSQAYIPVLQMQLEEFPEIRPPDGQLLLQVLWCPALHEIRYSCGYDYAGPKACLRWCGPDDREAMTEVRSVSIGEHADEVYIPKSCTLSPERIVEYPDTEQMPDEVKSALLNAPEFDEIAYGYGLSMARGWKVGGWPTWRSTDFQNLYCETCKGPVDLLLKLDTSEWDGGSNRWRPLDVDHMSQEEADDAMEPTGMILGHWGEIRIFACCKDIEHALLMNIQ